MRKLLRLITFALIVIAILAWVGTIYGWLVTEPGFEPLATLISAILSSLLAIFGWLKSSPDNEQQTEAQNIPVSDNISSNTSFAGNAGTNNIFVTGGQNVTIHNDHANESRVERAEEPPNELPSYQSFAQSITDVQNLQRDVEVLETRITLEDKLTMLGAVHRAWVDDGITVFELQHEITENWGFDAWKRANVAKYLVGRGFLVDRTPDYVANISYTRVSLTQEGLDWYREHFSDS